MVFNPKMPVKDVDVGCVANKLPACRMKTELQALLASTLYKYVNGFVSTTKHRQLVAHVVHVSFVSDSTGLRVVGFSYEDDEFPGYSIREALEVLLQASKTWRTFYGATRTAALAGAHPS